MKATSASPTVSASAVTSVRPGWRTAFSRARRPVIPRQLTIRPIALAERRDHAVVRRGVAAAQARAQPHADGSPRTRAAAAAGHGCRSTTSIPITTTSETTKRMTSARRDGVARGIGTPSRIAASGGTRVARSAGASPASTVTIVPASSDTMIVRDCSTVPLSGRSAPNALNSWSSAGASASPSSSPSSEPSEPEQQPFDDDRAHDLGARGAERAQQAELARALGDRDRERVEDDERADEQRDVGENQQERAQEAELGFEVRGLLGGLFGAGADRHRGRQGGAHAAAQLVGGDARLGRHVDLVVTGRARRPRAGPRRRSGCAVLAPPKDCPPPNFAMPTIR